MISNFEQDTNFHKILTRKVLTRDEMIAFIKENPNVKIKHEYFNPSEYIYSKENGEVYTEDGYLFEDWYSSEFTGHSGIRKRKGDGWESGWSIYKVPSDGLCGKTDEDNLGFTYGVLNTYI